MHETAESPDDATPASLGRANQIDAYDPGSPWQDCPLDDILIRQKSTTVHDVVGGIRNGFYVMDPEFQRDFIWKADRQSKLIESVIMRIPLPVCYLAENGDGRMIVVDGLQRLSTFDAFLNDRLVLCSLDREELNGQRFSDLSPKMQNRIDDCILILYVIDFGVPDRAKLDIFDRVNSGFPLSRQQMRNSLYMGKGTRFLKAQAQSDLFRKVTGGSLNSEMMRDREFVNRFCAFSISDLKDYRGDMDHFLATALQRMNQMNDDQLTAMAKALRRTLVNNYSAFRHHAFRLHVPNQNTRGMLNASLWDVMSTGLSGYSETRIMEHKDQLRSTVQELLADDRFLESITRGTSGTEQVMYRFKATGKALKQTMGWDDVSCGPPDKELPQPRTRLATPPSPIPPPSSRPGCPSR